MTTKENSCPLRVNPYSTSDDIPLCPGKTFPCMHVLLPGERLCPCCTPTEDTTKENAGWPEEEFDKEFMPPLDGSRYSSPDRAMLLVPHMREYALTIKSFITRVVAEAVADRDRELREKIEAIIDANDDGMWTGRETADNILALLTKTKE